MTITMEEISREKKYNIITNGNNINPKALSNNNEKNTVNFDKPLAFKTNPKNCRIVIFIKKKSNTKIKVMLIDCQSSNAKNFEITNVKFIDINKNVSKLTLSVNAFSSLKY